MLLPAVVPLPGVPLASAVDTLRHWKYELEKVPGIVCLGSL